MRTFGYRRRAARAFTFVEVLVAIALLTIGFLGVYASLNASALLRETSNETNVAMFKLQATMEYLFSLPFDVVTTVLPAGTPVNITALTDSNPGNDFKPSNEQIRLAYVDPAADPLYFRITITWTSRTGTSRTEAISCGRAR
jgi:prepilin-type N-terminal cleavage/methylation domain-containing protein